MGCTVVLNEMAAAVRSLAVIGIAVAVEVRIDSVSVVGPCCSSSAVGSYIHSAAACSFADWYFREIALGWN